MNRRLLALVVLLLAAVAGADWPRFRGPTGDGASADRALPVRWGPEKNVVWKVKLPGPGSSSPVIWQDRVFVTCYTGYGVAKEGDIAKLRRHLLCLERKSGKVLWQRDIEPKLPEANYTGFITEHGYASSTPATDGERVYLFLGRTGVLAFDLDGKQLWQTEVGTSLNGWGSGSSPVLHGDFVIVNASVESSSLIALDKRTGKQAWRIKGISDCWSTPALVEVPGGQTELVLSTPDKLIGVDPVKGEQLWHCEGITTATASSTPVSRKGVIYAMGAGLDSRMVLAVRAGGRGDVTRTHVLWRQKAGANNCSPVLHGEHLYFISGQVWCLNTESGQVVFQERLYDTRGEYSSPVVANGKIIAFTRYGGAYVLAAAGKFEQLARNELGDKSAFQGSPAISEGHLFVRSNEFLYCIGENK